MKVMADVLVTTDWVAQHATDAGVRVVEVDVDTTAYDQGHVPGSAGWNWTTELCDTLVRDEIPARLRQREELRRLMDGVGQPRRRGRRETIRPPVKPEDYSRRQQD